MYRCTMRTTEQRYARTTDHCHGVCSRLLDAGADHHETAGLTTPTPTLTPN